MIPPQRIIVGTAVGVVSSATQSVGLTLQRKSHILEELRIDNHRPPYKRPLWRLGFSLFLIANILGSSIQITTLPLIILSPLQAIGLVFNSICASVLLHEGFSPSSILGTVLVGLGALLIAGFGSIEEPNHSLKELLELMKRDSFVLWIVISNTGVVLILLWINFVKALHSKKLDHYFCIDRLHLWLRRAVDIPIDRFRFVKGCMYGVVSGTLSAHSLLLAKSTVELIINSIMQSNFSNFRNLKCWVIIGSFFVLAITQLVFLNKGLRNVSTSILYPLVFCVYNIVNIINGLIFYDQLHILSYFQTFMITLGTLLVLLGVFALSWRLKDPLDMKESSYISERTSLISPNLDDADETGYVSFGSPKGELFPTIQEDHESSYDDGNSSRGGGSPLSPFRYASIVDTSTNHVGSGKSRRKSKRVMSYEQTELLSQLNQMPDIE